eukprot:CAMPEP_0173182126 /NCGR_PEP_ID=MMETSP1141-20130122/7662_1 /TAXON_ID=483371 /ORGANISM="non described non described, Strain CCMP2298" /LENGTH=271 /DNA_ID=CAMNT_0014105181 /DNA_START=156 /DNA_END=967 /DNA_ORIENTATION=+
MSGATSNYSELDEERFRVWLGRLAESCKEYLTDNESEGEGGNGGLTQEALVSGIHSALQSDSAHYPPWLKAHKSIVAGRLASSSEEIKVFLRHVAMPHALHGYTRTVREIFTTASASASASAPVVEGTEGIEGIEGTEAAVEAEGVEVEMAVPTTITTTITPPTDLQCGATMRLPMHLGPVLAPVRPPSRRKGAKGGGYEEVDAFFQGLVSGCGDGVVGLCKLADAQHRVNRADQHDDHQLAQWIENESARQKSSGLALAKREERLLVLRG